MAKKPKPKKEKWDKPISKRGFKSICKKLSSWEKKYGFKGLRWAVNRYITLRNASMQREKEVAKLSGELEELKKKQKQRGMIS